MKNLLIFTLMFVFSFGHAQDQELKQDSPEKRAQQKIDRLDKHLQFSETQKKELTSFLIEQMEVNEKMREERFDTRKEIRKNMEEEKINRKESRKKIEAERVVMQENISERRAQTENRMREILTPEQFEKWQKIKEERSQIGKERRAQRHENRAKQIRKSERTRSSSGNRNEQRR